MFLVTRPQKQKGLGNFLPLELYGTQQGDWSLEFLASQTCFVTQVEATAVSCFLAATDFLQVQT